MGIISSVIADCIAAIIISLAAVVFGDRFLYSIQRRLNANTLTSPDFVPQIRIDMFDNPVGNPVLYAYLVNQGHVGIRSIRWFECEYESGSFLRVSSLGMSAESVAKGSMPCESLRFGLAPELFGYRGPVARTVFLEFSDDRGVDYRASVALVANEFVLSNLTRISTRLKKRGVTAYGKVNYYKEARRFSLDLPCG